LNPDLQAYLAARAAEFDQIPIPRKERLRKLALYVKSRTKARLDTRLIFICTHNSRRSHMSALWAHVAATHFGLDRVSTFSGGTEATAFNPRAVAALSRAGFAISVESPGDNPVYTVGYSAEAPALKAFSKIYSSAPNPTEDFAAVMTCSQADRNCPNVRGASLRVATPYEDPKAADGTAEESQRYDERSRQIAREMLYLFQLAVP